MNTLSLSIAANDAARGVHALHALATSKEDKYYNIYRVAKYTFALSVRLSDNVALKGCVFMALAFTDVAEGCYSVKLAFDKEQIPSNRNQLINAIALTVVCFARNVEGIGCLLTPLTFFDGPLSSDQLEAINDPAHTYTEALYNNNILEKIGFIHNETGVKTLIEFDLANDAMTMIQTTPTQIETPKMYMESFAKGTTEYILKLWNKEWTLVGKFSDSQVRLKRYYYDYLIRCGHITPIQFALDFFEFTKSNNRMAQETMMEAISEMFIKEGIYTAEQLAQG